MKTNERVFALDGLRGLAVLMVIMYHYWSADNNIFSMGWMGVDLFFVLSGYLISKRLFKTIDHKLYFKEFYRNRILRIFPLYYGLLIGFYLLIYFFVSEHNQIRFQYYYQNWTGFAVFIQNFVFIKYGLPKEPHLTHLWSLAVEEQFYLAWPIVILTWGRKKYFTHFIGIMIIGIMIARWINYYNTYQLSEAPYYHNSFYRFDSILMGYCVYYFQNKKHLVSENIKWMTSAFAIVTIIAIIIQHSAAYNSWYFGTVGYTILAFIFSGSIYVCVINERKNEMCGVQLFLSNKWLVKIGTISYGLYIFHIPVLIFFQGHTANLFNSVIHNVQLQFLISKAICLLMTFILSIISYKYFEGFFLSLKHQKAN